LHQYNERKDAAQILIGRVRMTYFIPTISVHPKTFWAARHAEGHDNPENP
jgi:hypothetical protein